MFGRSVRLLQHYEIERLRALRAVVKVGTDSFDRSDGFFRDAVQKHDSEPAYPQRRTVVFVAR